MEVRYLIDIVNTRREKDSDLFSLEEYKREIQKLLKRSRKPKITPKKPSNVCPVCQQTINQK